MTLAIAKSGGRILPSQSRPVDRLKTGRVSAPATFAEGAGIVA